MIGTIERDRKCIGPELEGKTEDGWDISRRDAGVVSGLPAFKKHSLFKGPSLAHR